MSKKIGVLVALASVCALSLLLLNCGGSSSRPSGTLYALTQGSNGYGNNVSSFAVNLDTGDLSLVNSNASTCPTAASTSNPEPCGLPLQILLDPTGAIAFVLNQGTPCTPTPTPPSCTSNGGDIPPTIYSYNVGSDGSLSSPITPAAATLTPGDTAISMALDATGNFLFVITSSPQLAVYSTKPGSTSLTPVSTLSLTKIPSALSAITFTPSGASSAQELLFVTNNFDLNRVEAYDNTVSVYSVDSTGALTEQPNSPYIVAAVDPVSVLAVNTIPPGQTTGGGLFVYVGNNGPSGGSVNPFELCIVQNSVCSAQQVTQNLMVPVTTCNTSCILAAGQNPAQMLVDPTNSFLYVMSEGSNQVFSFLIGASGTLTALNPPSQPTGAQPVSMAMHPSVNNTGQFLYTSDTGSSSISGFSLSTTTGSMSGSFTVVAPASPSGIAVH